jgi:hypothetical protein
VALQLDALREALIEAGASHEKAGRAAEELAGYGDQFIKLDLRMERLEGVMNTIRWMVGTNIALTVVMLARLFTH